MREVRVVSGSPLGVEFDAQENLVSLAFLLEDGDHLHIQIIPQSLASLSRHIERVASQLSGQRMRGPQNDH